MKHLLGALAWLQSNLVGLAALAVFTTVLILWCPWCKQVPLPVNESVPARPAAEVKGEELEDTPPPKVLRTYSDIVKPKLNLPPSVIASKTEKVISTAKVPEDDHAHTVTTTVDLDSGEAISYVRTDPLPWLAREVHGEIGLAYGLKNSEQVYRLSARQNLLQSKAVRLGGQATLDSDGDWFAGVGLFYRW